MFIKGGVIKRRTNQWIFGLIIILAGILFQLFEAEGPVSGFELSFLDVGQGDAIYIRGDDGFEVLIDGGPDKSILQRLDERMASGDRYIDVIVLTHPHADHVAGLNHVLDSYKVGQVILTDATHTTATYLAFLDKIKQKNIAAKLARSGQSYNWGQTLVFEVLFPQESYDSRQVSNLNLTSIVGMLRYRDKAMLLTGDAESPTQEAIMRAGSELAADLLKVPHQGAADSLNQRFLDAVSPRYAIIFSGKNNQFGHPHASFLEALDAMNIEIFDTQKHGTISFRYEDGELVPDFSR